MAISGDWARMTPLPHAPQTAPRRPEATPTGPHRARETALGRLLPNLTRIPDHPVRRWVASRGLYWPSPVPLPNPIRWLPAELLGQHH